MSKSKKKTMVLVIVSDHSSLGGPMGSESTPPVAFHICSTEDRALTWSAAWVKKHSHLPDKWDNMSKQQRRRWLGDFGPYGISFTTIEVD